jgi:hypothetical protein
MRQLGLLALLAPALLLPAACESSSSPSATPFTFEAGPGFEAGPPPEAGPLPLEDAGVDAADTAPPPPKGVTVTVVDGLTPKADVRVISQDATGAVIGDAKTDATGKLTIATAPSAVTVLATSFSAPKPVTFLAVADGDNLVVRIPLSSEESPVGTYSISFTAGMLGQSIHAQAFVNGKCNNTTPDTSMPPLLIGLFPSCLSAANTILAVGTNTDFVLDGFAFKKSVVSPAANATSPVTLPAWSTPGTTTLSATNTPGGQLSMSGDLFMIANGASFPASRDSSPGPVNSVAGQGYRTATGFADAYQSWVRSFDDVTDQVETSIIRREATTAPATATLAAVDFTTALPYVTAAAVDTTTAARPIVTLTSDKPLTGIDAGLVVLSWTTASQAAGTWTFVVPASAAATFKAPALPADATAFTPIGAVIAERAAFFEATQIPGYTEAKLLPVTPGIDFALLAGSEALPANGTVRLTTWAPRPPLR